MANTDPIFTSAMRSLGEFGAGGASGISPGSVTGGRAASQNRDDGFVHHGSLLVDRTIDAQFRKAETYLRGDSIMRKTLDGLEHAKEATSVVGVPMERAPTDYFDEATQRVAWDPYTAVRTTEGGRVSPALILGHELSHAIADPATRSRLAAVKDAVYDTGEERRVVRGPERHAARTLGEAVRNDHDATPYHVRSSVGRY